MSTLATRLACVAWVNLLDTDTALLPLVGNEAVELGKRPTVQFPLILDVLVVLATSHLRGLTNIGEVLKDYGCTSGGTGNNLFTQNVIAVLVKSHLLIRQLFQVSLGRFGSFALLACLNYLLFVGCLFFYNPRKGTFEGFGCFDASLNEDIGIQLRKLFSHLIVGRMVQLDPVLFVGVPSVTAHGIEHIRKLFYGVSQLLGLFGRHMKLYLYRSIHVNGIAYTQTYCKYTSVYEVKETGRKRRVSTP